MTHNKLYRRYKIYPIILRKTAKLCFLFYYEQAVFGLCGVYFLIAFYNIGMFMSTVLLFTCVSILVKFDDLLFLKLLSFLLNGIRVDSFIFNLFAVLDK